MSHHNTPAPTPETIGTSVEGRPIELYRLTRGPVKVLIIGGVHGDEPEGFFLSENFLKSGLWSQLENQAELLLVPRLNPDGCSKNERRNARGVDLNRNMPTKDWSPVVAKERYHPGAAPGSELETQILMRLVEREAPKAIFSFHSYDPMINYNGPCQGLAEYMSRYNHYIITGDIGYPTPGSLGTWAGWERKIPTITLEIERDSQPEKIWETHSEALVKALEYVSNVEDLDRKPE
jgi:protein MpaA